MEFVAVAAAMGFTTGAPMGLAVGVALLRHLESDPAVGTPDTTPTDVDTETDTAPDTFVLRA